MIFKSSKSLLPPPFLLFCIVIFSACTMLSPVSETEKDTETKTQASITLTISSELEEKVKEVPNVEKLLAIKGVGPSTVIGFIAEVGDIGRFTDPKQIQKLAGLEIVKKSSGKKKGQPRISKRGRRKLRRTMYESARALINWNPAFQDVFLYYRNRQRNPLGGMQAKIAVACKAIRVFYVVLQTGCDFDEEKFRRDIIRPEAA